MNTKTMPYLLGVGVLALTIGCGKGKISGTVTNSAGKALDVATVKADPVGNEAKTDSAGKYALDDVSRGDQSVTASKTGYESLTKSIKIGGTFKGDEATLDFALGTGYGSAHTLTGTTWSLTVTQTQGTAGNLPSGSPLTFSSETAGTLTVTSGNINSVTVKSLTHTGDQNAEHTDNITLDIIAGTCGTLTATGTRKGASMSGAITRTVKGSGTECLDEGTWSAILK